MNDPANLALYSELVRFKVDLSRTEVRFILPDNLKQRTLLSFAHGLGLQYEYSVDSLEARITQVIVFTRFEAGTARSQSREPIDGRRGPKMVFGSSSNIDANDTSSQ
jgi:hypothetical protein